MTGTISEHMHPPEIGTKLKAFRQDKGWSLARLAQATGISDATLSRVETGKTLITAHNLYILSKVLNVDITAFYSSDTSPLRSGVRSISRQGEGSALSTRHFLTTVLAADLSHKQMHPAINLITDHTPDAAGGLTGHAGEEFIYVIDGTLELHSTHYEPLSLNAGDAIYFDGTMPHAYVAGGSGPAKILVITTSDTTPQQESPGD